MSDILDTMNELAEKKNHSGDMDVIADMAPPIKRTPPPPPTPPPCRLSCSSCGYTAPEPEFRKNHPYCRTGRVLIVVLSVLLGTLVMLPFVAMYININS